MTKKLTPLPQSSTGHACLDSRSQLDGVEPAGQAKVFIWRNIGLGRQVTLQAERGFSLMQTGRQVLEANVGKVGSPIVAWVGG